MTNTLKTERSAGVRVSSGKFILCAAVLFPALAVIVSNRCGIWDDASAVHSLMLTALGAEAAIIIYRAVKNKLGAEELIMWITLAGIIMRVGYNIYTPANVRGHDQGVYSETASGHVGYIYKIIHGALPQSNADQFYHPPLFHFIAACFIKFGAFINGGDCGEFLKFGALANSMASCITLCFFGKILEELDIEARHRIIPTLLAAFLPNYYIMIRLNNDAFVMMFMTMAVFYTLRWHNGQDLESVIKLALSISLGMASKISGGIIALFTGPVMLYHLLKAAREKRLMATVIQLAVFAVICIPIGMWYPMRNLIRFSQPFGYVRELDPITSANVYSGNVPLINRLLEAHPFAAIKNPYMDMSTDKVIFYSLTKTPVFGEFSYKIYKFVPVMLYYANLLLMAVSVIDMIYVMLCDEKRVFAQRFAPAILWGIFMVSYISFNIRYPFTCTADFRYIPLTPLIGAVYMTYAARLRENGSRTAVIYGKAVNAVVVIWSVLSVVMYVSAA